MFRYRHLVAAGAGAALLSATPLFAQLEAPPDAPASPATADQAVSAEGEVYNRGPLHEAFATPSTNDPLESPVIPQAPPELIDEVPPDEQPVGDNIIWIPGYWAFDEELGDFLWVSGLWRDAPPDREWVPGYWVEAEGGHRWVHGMWASAEVNEITYLPQPPASQEQGPSSPAPDENYFYIPGNWEYHDVDYRWRPGFWAPRQRDWLWVPACYHWSPGGYVYTPGYWDYGLTSRGVVYAPVYFHGGFRGRYYQPAYALNTWEHLLLHLFVQPSYGHYVFGNYYGAGFANRGILPWYQYGRRNRGYDPLFSYYNWRFGDRYVGRLDQWHDYFERNENYRPRRTLREEVDFARANPDNEVIRRTRLASRIDEYRDRQELPVDFREVDETSRERYRDRVKELRDFTQRRRDVELAGPTDADVAQPGADQAREGRDDRRTRRTLELPRRVARDIDDSGLPHAIDQPDATDRPDANRPDVVGRDREDRTREDQDRDAADQRDRDAIDRRLRDGTIRTPERPDQMRDIRPDTPDGDEPRIPDRRERDRTRDLTPDRTFPQVPGANETPDRTPQPQPTPDRGNRRDQGDTPRREADQPSRREADQPSGDRPNRIERETRRVPQPQQQPDRPAVQPRPERQQPSTDRSPQRRQPSAQPDRSNSGSRRGSDQGTRSSQRSSDRGNSNQGNRGGSNRGNRSNRGDR